MTDPAQGDEIEALLLGMAKAHALGSSFFDAESVSTCERAAAELASLRERLAKAEGLLHANGTPRFNEAMRRAEAAEARALLAESKLAEAVEAEREACATVADDHASTWGLAHGTPATVIAAAIRARSTLTKIKEADHVAG
jgi:hypothetical protein